MSKNHEILVAVKAAAKAAWHTGHGRLDHDTCLSEANEAVAQAMRTYDPSKGASLSTYSANRVRWQVKKLLHKDRHSISLPPEWFDAVPMQPTLSLKEVLDGTELRIATLWGVYRYTYREIAAMMGVSCFRVFEVMKQVRKQLQEGDESGIRSQESDN